ncbi:MAG: ester cyclase [Haliscomenobacter sp.]|uniref:ester cyclase n=1 Tax=Haliscomenobacter sp. TaxID=2717303 RepID=UPI0029ADB111|nr:ester cyclase [Haliscomenobacter sp.]MDX2066861.1 ester cyclase [Haliscomenobacter sp.]
MENLMQNKEFILEYFNAISGVEKTPELVGQFTTDQHLIEHIAFFDSVFPKYELFADEITAEGNRVIVRARMTGKHEGEFNGIPPTYRSIDFPFAIGYEIEKGKIVSHWLIADQMHLLELLGIEKAVAE